ncbi:MAG: hypothetical protein WC756_13375 [Taibaiella sp.]|jgi:hypothetical protein
MIDIENNEFEERADYIDEVDLLAWTVENDFFLSIQRKLIERGAKLIVGPRGTGKTHQFRHTYLKCLDDKELPIAFYVSFGKYYHLEPLLFNSANAINVFHTWVLAKIIIEVTDVAKKFDLDVFPILQTLNLTVEEINLYIEKAERNSPLLGSESVLNTISIQRTIEIIEIVTEKLKRKRAILLLDDAALTLTPDYLVEFFDVFRSLKTQHISPKASVYPGTTQYGPRFHVGQDAEEVVAWLNVEDESYSAFMDTLLEKRLQQVQLNNREIIDLLKYSSFGIPRAFITLVRAFQQNTGKTNQQKFNGVVTNQRDLLRKEYLSLALKLPQYSTIIKTGLDFFDVIVKNIVEANRDNPAEKKTHFGILEEAFTLRANRMIKFLIEAGFLYELSPLHDGPQRIFQRFIPHYLFLIQARAFSHTKGFSPGDILEFIQRKTDKRPIRKQFKSILNLQQIDGIKLNLPPCSNCGTERLSEDQKFCHSCGAPLVGHSAFEASLKITIEELPLPEWQIQSIKDYTNISTIEDILMSQSPSTELKKAKYIGDKRSFKIYKLVTDLLEEFLA